MLQSAHLALMVIDARCEQAHDLVLTHASFHILIMCALIRAGILGPDEALAQWLHRHFNREHVFLVANKADGAAARSGEAEVMFAAPEHGMWTSQ